MESKKIREIVPIEEIATKEKRMRGDKKKGILIGKLCQVFLRLLVIGSMGAACLITILNEMTVDMGEFVMRISYRVSPILMFYVLGTGVVCVYAILSVPMVCFCYKNRLFQFLDMIMMALAVSSASAASAVGYIAKFGNDTAGWTAICDYCEHYCVRSMISAGLSYFAIVCLLLICAISSNAKK